MMRYIFVVCVDVLRGLSWWWDPSSLCLSTFYEVFRDDEIHLRCVCRRSMRSVVMTRSIFAVSVDVLRGLPWWWDPSSLCVSTFYEVCRDDKIHLRCVCRRFTRSSVMMRSIFAVCVDVLRGLSWWWDPSSLCLSTFYEVCRDDEIHLRCVCRRSTRSSVMMRSIFAVCVDVLRGLSWWWNTSSVCLSTFYEVCRDDEIHIRSACRKVRLKLSPNSRFLLL